MTSRHELVDYADTLLDVGAYQDYCPNGLQVEGRLEVRRLVSGVTASQALIEAAAEVGADVLLVHHGYFWKGEEAPIRGMKYRRIKGLLDNWINLVAYHLPLDGHAELGNNAQLARLLGFAVDGRFGPGPDGGIAMYGRPAQPHTPEEMAGQLERALGRAPLTIRAGERAIKTVAWCTGAAQGFIDQAAALGVDAFISGEVSEPTFHAAHELGIHYFAAGHHATERYGVQALGAHLAEHFGLEHRFIDIDNPV